MRLELVNIADVYADENNPREKFEGIDEMAASFDLNTERPGEPFTPPIVVKDGGIYRIVDGERRYRALKKRKAKKFHANVCEDMDEALAMVAMVATDDKQPLTAAEKSKGVQMMLLLGVDPVEVDKGARLKKGTGRRIKRAMDAVGDATAAEDMSLDWLLAVEEAKGTEFEKPLIDASPATWPTLYTEFLRQKANAQLRKEYKAVLDAHGIEISDGMPDPQYRWDANFRAAADLEKWLDECEPGQLIARIVEYNRAECTIYRRSAVRAMDEMLDRKLNEAREEWREKADAHEKRLAGWFAENWGANSATYGIVRAKVLQQNAMQVQWWKEKTGEDLEGAEFLFGYPEMALTLAHIIHYWGPANYYWCAQPDGLKLLRHHLDHATKWCELVDAAVADGYELEEYEAGIVDAIAGALDALGGGADD